MNLRVIKIVPALLLLILYSGSFAQTQIAVVEFNSQGISQNEARVLTDRLMVELHRTNKFKLLEREMLSAIIEEQKFQMSGCTSDECLVELGQIANVEEIVGGSISKMGKVYSVTARLISVETGELIRTGIYDYEGDIGNLIKTGMAQIAAQLASNEVILSIPFTKPGKQETVTDIDGNVYATVRIGEQVWMGENLKVTQFRDGTPIPTSIKRAFGATISKGIYCIYNNDASNESETYGALYNWYAVLDARNIAPEGWHVPSDVEWQSLIDFLGGDDVAGGKLKESGIKHWDRPNSGADNSSSFAALPSGYRNYGNGIYYNLGSSSYFWSTTEYDNTSAWCRDLRGNDTKILRDVGNKNYGFAIRCIKD